MMCIDVKSGGLVYIFTLLICFGNYILEVTFTVWITEWMFECTNTGLQILQGIRNLLREAALCIISGLYFCSGSLLK